MTGSSTTFGVPLAPPELLDLGRDGSAVREVLAQNSAQPVRLAFRPDDHGAMKLLLAARRLPGDDAAFSLADYGVARTDEVRLARTPVPVRPLSDSESDLAYGFYRRLLQPAELDSLALDDLSLSALDAAYRPFGLHRSRVVFIAFDRRRVLGACLVNHGPGEPRLPLLADVVEHLRVSPRLSGAARADTWNALTRAALEEVARERDEIVTLSHPDERELAVRAGLLPARPLRYAVATAARGGGRFLRGARLSDVL